MTADIKQKLRKAGALMCQDYTIMDEAADRLEQLEKASEKWAEVSQTNYKNAKRAKRAIARLERVTAAVEGLVGPDWESMWFQKEAKDKSK